MIYASLVLPTQNKGNCVEIYGNCSKYVMIISKAVAKQLLRIQDNNQQMLALVRYLTTSRYLNNLIGATTFLVAPIFFYSVSPALIILSKAHETRFKHTRMVSLMMFL